jgi:hypothetical protein
MAKMLLLQLILLNMLVSNTSIYHLLATNIPGLQVRCSQLAAAAAVVSC